MTWQGTLQIERVEAKESGVHGVTIVDRIMCAAQSSDPTAIECVVLLNGIGMGQTFDFYLQIDSSGDAGTVQLVLPLDYRVSNPAWRGKTLRMTPAQPLESSSRSLDANDAFSIADLFSSMTESTLLPESLGWALRECIIEVKQHFGHTTDVYTALANVLRTNTGKLSAKPKPKPKPWAELEIEIGPLDMPAPESASRFTSRDVDDEEKKDSRAPEDHVEGKDSGKTACITFPTISTTEVSQALDSLSKLLSQKRVSALAATSSRDDSKSSSLSQRLSELSRSISDYEAKTQSQPQSQRRIKRWLKELSSLVLQVHVLLQLTEKNPGKGIDALEAIHDRVKALQTNIGIAMNIPIDGVHREMLILLQSQQGMIRAFQTRLASLTEPIDTKEQVLAQFRQIQQVMDEELNASTKDTHSLIAFARDVMSAIGLELDVARQTFRSFDARELLDILAFQCEGFAFELQSLSSALDEAGTHESSPSMQNFDVVIIQLREQRMLLLDLYQHISQKAKSSLSKTGLLKQIKRVISEVTETLNKPNLQLHEVLEAVDGIQAQINFLLNQTEKLKPILEMRDVRFLDSMKASCNVIASAAGPNPFTDALDGFSRKPQMPAAAVYADGYMKKEMVQLLHLLEPVVVTLTGPSAEYQIPFSPAQSTAGKNVILIHNGNELGEIYTLRTGKYTIDGIPDGQYRLCTRGERLRLCSTGSGWTILEHFAETDWSAPAPLRIVACGTNTLVPKHSRIQFDQVRWRRVGRDVEVVYRYIQSEPSSEHTGMYWIALPENIEPDYRLCPGIPYSEHAPIFQESGGCVIGSGTATRRGKKDMRWIATLTLFLADPNRAPRDASGAYIAGPAGVWGYWIDHNESNVMGHTYSLHHPIAFTLHCKFPVKYWRP